MSASVAPSRQDASSSSARWRSGLVRRAIGPDSTILPAGTTPLSAATPSRLRPTPHHHHRSGTGDRSGPPSSESRHARGYGRRRRLGERMRGGPRGRVGEHIVASCSPRSRCLKWAPRPAAVDSAGRSLIDATPLRAAAHDPFPQYHEIAAEARMTPGVVDSLGFEELGDIGPAPPEARLSYY